MSSTGSPIETGYCPICLWPLFLGITHACSTPLFCFIKRVDPMLADENRRLSDENRRLKNDIGTALRIMSQVEEIQRKRNNRKWWW